MRKRLAILLALCLSTVMAVGVIGSGAQFTFEGTAVQKTTVEVLHFTLSSTTPGATVVGDTVTCPWKGIKVSQTWDPADQITCNVTVTNTGTMAPENLSVLVTGVAELPMNVGAFAISEATLHPTPLALTGALQPVKTLLAPIANVNSFDFVMSWGVYTPELTNSDMGRGLTVTYQINSAQ